jgi:hypothetical protein
VLYDKYYEAEFARLDLVVYLPRLYRTQSELVVLFLCPEYAAKRWCNLEWRHIRQLIATVNESRIMLLRYGYSGDFDELGILPGDGTINFEGRAAEDIAEKIRERFNHNHGIAPPKPSPGPIPADISRIIKYAPAELIGREAETKLLADAWAKAQNNVAERPRFLTFVALGDGREAQGRWHQSFARRAGRQQPRPVRGHHPLFDPGLAGLLADYRAEQCLISKPA